jgi:hypothetical protein
MRHGVMAEIVEMAGDHSREFWRDYEIANNFGAQFLSLIM